MAPPKFHLGWFMNFTPDEWNEPFACGGQPWDGEFYLDFARSLDRAGFDYIMIEDTLMVSDAYGGSMESYMKHALMAPKHDPSPLAAIMSQVTRQSVWWPPFPPVSTRRSCWPGCAPASTTSPAAVSGGTS